MRENFEYAIAHCEEVLQCNSNDLREALEQLIITCISEDGIDIKFDTPIIIGISGWEYDIQNIVAYTSYDADDNATWEIEFNLSDKVNCFPLDDIDEVCLPYLIKLVIKYAKEYMQKLI